MTKACGCCGHMLEPEAFYRRTGTWDGRQPWCKRCTARARRPRVAWRPRTTRLRWPPAPRATPQEDA